MTEEAWMTFMPDGTDDDVWYTNPEGKLPEGYTYQKLNPNWSKEMAQPEQEPVGKLQEATAERAWFTIAELNAWADKKLSENPHWVMPKDEPERDEPPPQRTWVGLTDGDFAEACQMAERGNYLVAFQRIQAKLKEKNT